MSRMGLGIDVGGTATRWALADASGQTLATGAVGSLHGVVSTLGDDGNLHNTIEQLVQQVHAHGTPDCVVAGISGYDELAPGASIFPDSFRRAWALPSHEVLVCNDIVTSYLSAFQPGEGYLVYAGTGAVSAYLRDDGVLLRAGGRGILIDDAGGGAWIAKEALKRLWRLEEEQPGYWQASALARAFSRAMGGSQWRHTRQHIYASQRGAIGKLAMHVAATAEVDAVAQAVLCDAGRELARLANVHLKAHGPRPVALAGGAALLHPMIFESMQASLCIPTVLQPTQLAVHQKSAAIAASDNANLRDLLRSH